jgi:hypothetical protein
MSSTYVLLAWGAIFLVILILKVMIPVLHLGGLGVEIMVPAVLSGLARRYPRATFVAFNIGGPCLSVAVLFAIVQLVPSLGAAHR